MGACRGPESRISEKLIVFQSAKSRGKNPCAANALTAVVWKIAPPFVGREKLVKIFGTRFSIVHDPCFNNTSLSFLAQFASVARTLSPLTKKKTFQVRGGKSQTLCSLILGCQSFADVNLSPALSPTSHANCFCDI